jgi:lysophospholipase L1-like esterase
VDISHLLLAYKLSSLERMMKYILCFGDSNTWGCIPETMNRYDPNERWPGILQRLLGEDYYVYENGMNGRTTVFEDPIEEHRCGKAALPIALEVCAPLDLVIIMLGTNDCKNRFSLEPWDIGWGMDLLLQYVKKAHCGHGDDIPRILIVSPPKMGEEWEKTVLGTVFGLEANRRIKALPEIYKTVALNAGAWFLDAALYTEPGCDCIHLERESNEKLASAMCKKVKEIFQHV